jgi:ribonuclease J
MLNCTKRKVIQHGQSINLGAFRIEFIKTNHSIVDASALAIYSPAGIVIHTGDFKVDYTPVFGDAIDLQRFGEIGKKGVLALMCDSTNAERPGFTMSERTVGSVFDNIMSEHRNSRIIIATFASNVDRVQQIINSAYKYGRKVVVEGRSMVNVIKTAAELGYLSIPDKTLIDIEMMKNYPDDQVVLITTGSQGESMAALSRIAASIHKKVQIKPGDTVIFSSKAIPGNEKAVSRVINELSMKGADVIFQDAHVSGHACQEEIKLIYSLVRPKYAIPIHGEYRHRKAQADLAMSLGIPKENTFIISSGDVLEVSEESAQVVDQVRTGAILVDGLGVGDVGNIVLRDRQHLAEDGIMIVVMTLEKYSNQLLAGPDIVSRGFVYVRESEDLMEEARAIVDKAVNDSLERGISDWGKLKTVIKDSLSDYIWKKTKRNPMILPIIMEV